MKSFINKATWNLIPRFGFISLLNGCQNPITQKNKQEFEGIIDYTVTITTHGAQRSIEQMYADMGKTKRFHYKQGKYRLDLSSEPPATIVYLPHANKEYVFKSGWDTLLVADQGIQDQTPTDFKFEPAGDAVVLGHPCRLLTYRYGAKEIQDWVPNDMYIPAERFEKAKVIGINLIYQQRQAPYLKNVRKSKIFTITEEAYSIQEKPLHDSLFAIPTGLVEVDMKEYFSR